LQRERERERERERKRKEKEENVVNENCSNCIRRNPWSWWV